MVVSAMPHGAAQLTAPAPQSPAATVQAAGSRTGEQVKARDKCILVVMWGHVAYIPKCYLFLQRCGPHVETDSSVAQRVGRERLTTA